MKKAKQTSDSGSNTFKCYYVAKFNEKGKYK